MSAIHYFRHSLNLPSNARRQRKCQMAAPMTLVALRIQFKIPTYLQSIAQPSSLFISLTQVQQPKIIPSSLHMPEAMEPDL